MQMLKTMFRLGILTILLTTLITSCAKDSSDDPIVAQWIGLSQQIETYENGKVIDKKDVKISHIALDFYPDDSFTLTGNIGQESPTSIEGSFALYGSKITLKYLDKDQKSKSISVDYTIKGGVLEISNTSDLSGGKKQVRTTVFGKA